MLLCDLLSFQVDLGDLGVDQHLPFAALFEVSIEDEDKEEDAAGVDLQSYIHWFGLAKNRSILRVYS